MELQWSAPRSRTDRPESTAIPLLASFIAALLSLSFLVLIVSTLTGMQLGNKLLRPNPFTSLEAVWPGQSSGSVAAFVERTSEGGMLCFTGSDSNAPYSSSAVRLEANTIVGVALANRIVCSAASNTGTFRSMTTTVEQGQVQELVLFSDVLHQDSLFLYWGAPDAISSADSAHLYLHWNRESYAATAAVAEDGDMVSFITLRKRDRG